MQMLEHTLPMLFAREMRIVEQSILNGALNNAHGIYVVVGFGNNTSINATRLLCR